LGNGGSGMTGEAREHSFDELTRGMASGSIPRGKALKLMGAALVGGTLASVGIREAGADQCKPNGKVCKKNEQCCSGNCADGTCSACPAGRVELSNGTCAIERDPNACFCPENCFCRFEQDPASSTRVFCASSRTDTPCPRGHSDCPEGQFCSDDPRNPPVGVVCFVAC
jgi:hypothetical protein